MFRWRVESYLCWVSGSVSSSDSWGRSREKPCEWNHRVCGLTASNYRSDGVSLATVHTVSSHPGKDAAGVLLLFLCELENLRTNKTDRTGNRFLVPTWRSRCSAEGAAEQRSYLMSWWRARLTRRRRFSDHTKAAVYLKMIVSDCFLWTTAFPSRRSVRSQSGRVLRAVWKMRRRLLKLLLNLITDDYWSYLWSETFAALRRDHSCF